MQVYGSFLVMLSAFISAASAVPMPQGPALVLTVASAAPSSASPSAASSEASAVVTSRPTAFSASSYSVAIGVTSGFAYPSVSGAFPTAPAPPRATAAPAVPSYVPKNTHMKLLPNGKVEIIKIEHEVAPEEPKHAPVVHSQPADSVVVAPGKHHSFDSWGGLDSLKGFDDFYGKDNWDGLHYKQTFVSDRDLVCHRTETHIIQQRLLAVQEMAKRTILETLCDVEAQTIVWEQFLSGLHGFERDLVRAPRGHHRVGFDEGIISHFPKFVKHDGSLNVDDWHFSGHDLGKHTVVVRGDNWDDKRSFQSVRRAWQAARNAYYSIHGQFFQ